MGVSYNRNTGLALDVDLALWSDVELTCSHLRGNTVLLKHALKLKRDATQARVEVETRLTQARVEVKTWCYVGSRWSWNAMLLRLALQLKRDVTQPRVWVGMNDEILNLAWVSRLVLNVTLTLSSDEVRVCQIEIRVWVGNDPCVCKGSHLRLCPQWFLDSL